MLNVKKALTKILNAIKYDYIVDQGTSGIWTYRKYASGIAECWGAKPISASAWSTWGTNPVFNYIAASEEAYPTGLFISVKSVTGQLSTNAGDSISSITARPANMATTAPKITAIRPAAGSTPADGWAFWHTIGLWK